MCSQQAAAPPLPPPECVQFRAEQLQLSAGVPLGAGAISQVLQCALHRATAPALPVVVKVVSKVQVLQQGKVQSVMNEKAALMRLAPHPYVARLYGTAQSEDELYFVLEWLPHGDLLQLIRRVARDRVRQYNGCADATAAAAGAPPATSIPSSSTALRCLDMHDAQLITAQLVLALAHAAVKGVVLRDLKPENVAFDEKCRACLIDFDTADLDGAASAPQTNGGVACPPPVDSAADIEGTSASSGPSSAPSASPTASTAPARRRLTVSEIQSMRKKTASFCGTAQYVSPEMVGECKWSFSSDLWALGALVYELIYGVHIFAGMTQFEVLQKVIHGGYAAQDALFPSVDLGADGRHFAAMKSFVRQLLTTDPLRRLGVHPETHAFDLDALRRHAFFDGLDWGPLEEQLRTFRMRRFDAWAGPKAAASSAPPITEGAAVAPVASSTEPAALIALAAACVDPSPSLKERYHAPPFNDPAYAEYVYKATADANPFEKFFTQEEAHAAPGAAEEPPLRGHAVEPAPAPSPSPVNDGPASVPAPADAAEAHNNGSDEDEDDVIDDVGMRYTGRPADEDFQH